MKCKKNLSKVFLAVLMIFFVTRVQFPAPSSAALLPSRVPDPASKTRTLEIYGNQPLSFEANQGQTDDRVKFLSRGSGYNLFLTATESVLTLSKLAEPTTANAEQTQAIEHAVLRMQLIGANPEPQVVGLEELPGKVNHFIGNDPAKWRTNIPTFAKVKYQAVYRGVDLVYYGNQQQLEYDFVLAPGIDPQVINLSFEGADTLEVNAQGDLVLHTAGGPIRQRKPLIYQEMDGVRQEIAGGYVLKDTYQVGFYVAAYDAARPLVIDPVLVYSTYLGGSGKDQGIGMAVDAAGNAYVTGYTASDDFPTVNPLQPAFGGSFDAFVTKLNTNGSALVYSTYLGGSGNEDGARIAVDTAGNVYMTGYTTSSDFPTVNPLQPTFGGIQDAFVAKLNTNGSALVYSTYLGGSESDGRGGIAVDAAGNAYVTGHTTSSDFPMVNPLQPTFGGSLDAFVAKLNANGSALVYSTYLGGSSEEYGLGLAVDAAGNAYLNGLTTSSDFPTVNPLQPAFGGSFDAFVAKLNANGSALVYSTYLGGSSEEYSAGMAVDGAGNAYLNGLTASSDFPTVNPFQSNLRGVQDAFVAKLNANGSALVYSTYLGGNGEDQGVGLAVDAAGNVYMTGSTTSSDFPTVNPLQPTFGGVEDAFVAKLNTNGSALVYSTYLGGGGEEQGVDMAVDAAGNGYVTGYTTSSNFPTVNPLQTAFGGDNDAFIIKISPVSGQALYVWRDPAPARNGTPIDLVEAQRLAEFAVAEDIGTIFYDNFGCGLSAGCPPGAGLQDSATLTPIISLLHAQGLQVEALYTDNTRINDVVTYNNNAPADARFDRIRLNIEAFPSGASEPNTSTDLDIYTQAVAAAGDLPIYVSISHHWDNLIIYNNETREAYKHILDIVAGVDVQTAQDNSGTGPDARAIERLTMEEVCYANSIGKPVHITIETYDVVTHLQGLNDFNTFFDEGEAAMKSVLADIDYTAPNVNAPCAGPIPNGFAYHFYRQSFGSATLPRWASDTDGDNIADPIDTIPTSSIVFSDAGLGGATTGEITTSGDQTFLVADAIDPNDGVLITSAHYGGQMPATISACNGASLLSLSAGDVVVITCSSVTAEVIRGPVEMTLFPDVGPPATATLGADNSITFDPTTSTFSAPLANPDTIVILVAGQEIDLAPGEVIVPNEPPIADSNGPYVVEEGESITLDASSSSDPDGTITLYEWDLHYDGVTFDVDATGPSPLFDATNLDGPASRTVALRVTDDDNGSDLASTTVTINNVAPTVEAITVEIDDVAIEAPVIEKSSSIEVSANFSDSGTVDTHTAEWYWGDGTQPTVSPITDGSRSVSGSHTYDIPGVFTIRLTVTDNDAGSGEAVFQFVVVFDPEGGFVTGGGWINSPEGAYAPNPSLTGKANFGFVSKYKKGATVPTGETEFQFKVADLSFHSDTYDWLVVSHHRAQFKGTGTINGVGNYGFMLTAVDEKLTPSTDIDLFRIKIWDKDSGDAVIYDNQVACTDGDDDADPCTAIGGGSIVIHKGN